MMRRYTTRRRVAGTRAMLVNVIKAVLAGGLMAVLVTLLADDQRKAERRRAECAARGGVIARGQFEPVCVAAPSVK